MGSEQQSEEGNKEDYITLQVIQESLNIKEPILFKKYLQEIFNDLSNRGAKNKNIKYMSRTTFYDYIKLPIFIAEKLFSSFSNRNKDGLLLEEFVDGLYNLYTGSFEDTAKIIFNLLDFNKDGLINNDDVKIILSYLPLNDNNNIIDNDGENKKEELVSKIFGEQMKSLEEIDEIVKNTFNRYEGEINLEQFIESIKNNNSEVYLQILCFLYEQIPFTSKNIDCIKKKYYSFDEKEYEGISISQRSDKKKNSIQIKTPKKSSMLSPAGTFLNKRLRIRSFTLNEEAKQIIKDELNGLSYSESKTSSSSKENNPSIKNDLNENKEIKNEKNINNIDIVRFDNENIINEINSEENKDNSNNVIDNLCKKSKKNYVSPTKYLQEKVCLNQITLNGSHIGNQLRTINEESEIGEKTSNLNVDNNNEEQNICYENWIYKITEENKIKKFYLVLSN